MASDTQMTNGNLAMTNCDKIFQIGNWVVGFAGDQEDVHVLKDWLGDCYRNSDRILDIYKKPIPEDTDTEIMIVDPCDEYIAFVSPKGRVSEACARFGAIGSGQDFALGAMSMGACAREAVEVAAMFDIYTGDEVVTIPPKGAN